jgi:hypothetical protein
MSALGHQRTHASQQKEGYSITSSASDIKLSENLIDQAAECGGDTTLF